MTSIRTIALPVLVALIVAACAHEGGVNTNPVVRKFTWFSYLNGGDIRSTCTEGAPDRYRFVYNGIYTQQVRTYDIEPDGGGNGFLLTTRVIGPTNISQVFISNFSDIFSPGRGTIRRTLRSPADIAALNDALTESGFFGPPPVGLDMRDLDFFWIGSACVAGTPAFNAYRWPSERFETATFPQILLAWDPTGIPVAQPRVASRLELYGDESDDARIRANTFLLTVGTDGLVGVRN